MASSSLALWNAFSPGSLSALMPDASGRGPRQDVARHLQALALEERRRQVETLGGEEGVGHAAAQEQDVEARQEV